jgi:hypothetical protein
MSFFVFILSNCQAQNHAWAYWINPHSHDQEKCAPPLPSL